MRYLLGLFFLLFVLAGVSAQNTSPQPKQTTTKPKTKPIPSKKAVASKPAATKLKSTNKVTAGKKPPLKVKTSTTSGRPAQTTAKKNTVTSKPKVQAPKEPSEGEVYAKAASIEDPLEQVAALKAFLEKFPSSIRKAGILESIAITRIKLAQERLTAAETDSGIDLLKLAMKELPTPVPPKLFDDSISKIPTDLFNNGQRTGAVEVASLIEEKIGDNPAQLLSLANFFLMTENGAEAKALAGKAIAITPSSSAYQTLGLANRLNFQLDDASQAYAKALELEPDSQAIIRSLADLKRAQGKSDEAGELYQKILDRDAANLPAQTGLVLSLFDSGKTAEAEVALKRSLDENPGNIILLAGAAYWYAAHDNPDKAVDLALKAIEKEPRYIWSHIALAHGYLARKQPAEAEKVLLKARVYGNFPTLEYEIASARLMSGFYRDAIEELRKSFSIKDGVIHVKLGGRVDSEQSSFVELLAGERRASTFEPESADDRAAATRLKSLLEFDQAINTAEPAEDAVVKAADAFIAGDDNMKLHRQLYAASSLLNRDIALTKVADMTQSAVGNTDAALDVPDPGAAVMASELYESRSLLLARNELLEVPPVPRATLSAILRGRIEELAGWTLFNQNKPGEAVVRLRRAVSVMPDKSAWWRSSMWRLGAALQADGKDGEALDSYIRSYSIDKPSGARYAVVESLYRKVHGNTEGLEAKIGVNPTPIAAQVPDTTTVAKVETPSNAASTDGSAQPVPTPTPEIRAVATTDNVPVAAPTPTPTPTIEPTPEPASSPRIEPTRSPVVEGTPVTASTPVTVEPTPSPTAEVTPIATPAPVAIEPTPTPAAQTTPTPVPTPTPIIIGGTASPTPAPALAEPTPIPDASPSAVASTPSPTPPPTPSLSPEPTPTPVEGGAAQKPDPDSKSKIVDIRPSDPQDQARPANKRPDDSSVAKQLFEPVIITIPKSGAAKPSETITEKKSDETAASPDKEKPSPTDADKNQPDKATPGDVRPRVIEGKSAEVADPPPCSIGVSQDTISILNNGGSLGILLRMDGPGELKSIRAVSNSPDDLRITLEPEIAGIKGQSFYVISSVTAKTGDFTVAFIAPCGRKEISVNVR